MAPLNKRTQSVGVKDVDQSELVKALAAYLKRLVLPLMCLILFIVPRLVLCSLD